VAPERALALGFVFEHGTIDAALTELLAHRRMADAPPHMHSVNDSR
jgi:hypothetical protein